MARNINPLPTKPSLPSFDGRGAKSIGNPDYGSARGVAKSLGGNLNSTQQSYLAHEIDKAGNVTAEKLNKIFVEAVKSGKINRQKAKNIERNIKIPRSLINKL